MPGKDFTLDNGQLVTIYKRRGGRNLRLSVNAHGKVRITIPAWAPYQAGIKFAQARKQWITDQHKVPDLLVNNQPVGKAHHLQFILSESTSRVSSRVNDTTVVVRYPADISSRDPSVQKSAREASIRALRTQAESLLPQRLAQLAETYGFEYRSVSVKRLTGRWGSCDSYQNIVLNLFLMQLPWQLIDYVLLHELTHTKVLKHGPEFWQAMESVLPGTKDLRKAIRHHHPVLNGLQPVA